ncbi:Hypothetical_protein [Hexamita inflata]|uniref:Hypothetical_protein n=1 Tax=Hexamita inflata TaxID=28002 RepID=A0AA86UM86_9EUKA|nr:Hypothetical protein HINF_LOCUS44537 [Hexamita inflata]CAI9956898.1 Hypothetical protein HINF_LOCUS44543 [Hexamita inflata]CAI9956904.1 Hypothetical protein HINF_LOCUS44549 [Hexamita inflata]
MRNVPGCAAHTLQFCCVNIIHGVLSIRDTYAPARSIAFMTRKRIMRAVDCIFNWSSQIAWCAFAIKSQRTPFSLRQKQPKTCNLLIKSLSSSRCLIYGKYNQAAGEVAGNVVLLTILTPVPAERGWLSCAE